MRIIAGELKGRRLKTPKWDGLRPTSDKLRETLFNVVARARGRCAGARSLCGHRSDRHRSAQPRRGARDVRRQRCARAEAHRREPASLRRPRPLCYYPNAAITAGRIDRFGRAGSALRRTRSDGLDCRGRVADCARRIARARARAPPPGAGAGRTFAHVA